MASLFCCVYSTHLLSIVCSREFRFHCTFSICHFIALRFRCGFLFLPLCGGFLVKQGLKNSIRWLNSGRLTLITLKKNKKTRENRRKCLTSCQLLTFQLMFTNKTRQPKKKKQQQQQQNTQYKNKNFMNRSSNFIPLLLSNAFAGAQRAFTLVFLSFNRIVFIKLFVIYLFRMKAKQLLKPGINL